ncbi:hypothetical protein PR002_g9948 [Phytophthora rubi]|uniref:Ubiquitin-like protease family profile domain-containing protein n=1 Tax=Phytophthora rubi TaxID=129364 RepID=A0A6A3MLG3_9STRA|nr:hypothetical protein PR002_g9948 [Phytophthora rubi]
MEVSPRIGMEGLPQVSSEESTGLTQISLASPASQTPSATPAEGDTDDLEEKVLCLCKTKVLPIMLSRMKMHVRVAHPQQKAERRPTSASSDTGPAQNSTEMLDKRTKVCYTFDPLQLKADFATVKSSVQNVIKHQVGLQNKITYKEIDWCKQRDNSSCGVWCLVVLELLLSESTWADSHYKVQPYLRMRYLYKATAVQETEVAHDED